MGARTITTPRPKPNAKPKAVGDFSEEYIGMLVRIHVDCDNTTIEGRLIEARRYWVKIVSGDRTIYINKAFIRAIEPIK